MTDRSSEANEVGQTVRALSAVVSAEVHCVLDFELGSNFELTVNLPDDAGEEDATRVGEVFSRAIRDADFTSTTTKLAVSHHGQKEGTGSSGGSARSSTAFVELSPKADYSKPGPQAWSSRRTCGCG